ncbi:MAG: RagB/SusD family nutrient uptake outer membrane protein [Bacteroidales bacterium]|nr:RagB/SusD family nutrient uptake outer membrane protein [Bacteroidales bacterium]
MKHIKYIIGAVLVALVMNSCVGDLNVTPIDPNANTADKVLVDKAAYENFLAGVYLCFATSGYYGANGSPSISGLDGGASQYLRGLYNLNELTTDESVCGWNDQTIKDLHWMCWTTADTFIYAFYSRIFIVVSMANEFIYEATREGALEFDGKQQLIDEARVLRAIAYYHAIDNFGNVPFNDKFDGSVPQQIKRADLYEWLEKELIDLKDNSTLPERSATAYGHVNKSVAKFLLAKLYLNAEVYTGTKAYDKCAAVLKDLMDDGYSLHTSSAGKYNAYQELFLADNNRCTDEIILAIEQDGINTTSYGATNYLIFASTGGIMDPDEMGISSGWGGLRTTPQFVDKFDTKDARYLFYDTERSTAQVEAMPEKPEDAPAKYDSKTIEKLKKDGEYDEECEKLIKAKEAAHDNIQQKDIEDIGNFIYGYGFMKYRNRTSDGGYGKELGFVDTDFPLMRYADVLLMAAECEARGAAVDGYKGFNAVRQRAGLAAISTPTLQQILDERGRELYQECWRRSDLIRFGKFTSADYLWQWKGNVKEGKAVDSYRALFPIPDSDRLANSNLVQNPGY